MPAKAQPSAAPEPDLDRLTFRPVTPSTRSDFEEFFTARGAPHFCWCMVWRRSTAESRFHTPADRKRQMAERLDRATPIGLLAYDGETPVAWASIAPRDTYRNLGGPPAKQGEIVWSLACFFVTRPLRLSGMTSRLIGAAVAYAATSGATHVEAYPVDRDAPSYRFMGFVDIFEKAGFRDIGMAGVRRHVLRRDLRQG